MVVVYCRQDYSRHSSSRALSQLSGDRRGLEMRRPRSRCSMRRDTNAWEIHRKLRGQGREMKETLGEADRARMGNFRSHASQQRFETTKHCLIASNCPILLCRFYRHFSVMRHLRKMPPPPFSVFWTFSMFSTSGFVSQEFLPVPHIYISTNTSSGKLRAAVCD